MDASTNQQPEVAAAPAAPTVVTSANKKETLAPHKVCKFEGCQRPHHAKGMCQHHYKETLKKKAASEQAGAAAAADIVAAGKPKAAPKKAAKPAKPKAERKPNADAGKPHVLSVYFPDLKLREAVLAEAKRLGITPGRRILMAVAKDFKFKLDE